MGGMCNSYTHVLYIHVLHSGNIWWRFLFLANWRFCDTAKIKPAKIIRDSLNNGTLTSITNFFLPTPLSANRQIFLIAKFPRYYTVCVAHVVLLLRMDLDQDGTGGGDRVSIYIQ